MTIRPAHGTFAAFLFFSLLKFADILRSSIHPGPPVSMCMLHPHPNSQVFQNFKTGPIAALQKTQNLMLFDL